MLVSVILCTHNREKQVLSCLESVASAIRHAEGVPVEVVVINNASKDNTEAVLNMWANQNTDIDLHVFLEEQQGIVYARNRSFKEAKGELLISIDDDCCMQKDYIETAVRYFKADNSPVLRFGRLDLGNPEDWPMTIQTRAYLKRWQKGHPDYDYINMGSVCSANMMIPKSIIEKVGNYDGRFGTPSIPGGEDADFGFRVYNAGFLIEYVPDVIATHFHGRRDEQTVRKLVRNYSIAAGALFAKYHVQHPHIYRKLFPKPETHQKNDGSYSEDERTKKILQFHKEYKKYYPLGMVYFILSTIKNFKISGS